ncbi:MAG: hypothetical protein A2W05_06465 [Candidatus Schekmanbacteria bacterium RBG_16_38_10]|uniref:Phosphodiesterase n=1 Tax=Candidatus Schekmanbacteria bacterium RBG_16_38_10 TaxID=1817879 RepID=A0A1F7RV44_9BACT|nr:MAG: hypothetical protein A2W05_06465 [Candidatus Schekmanbacteria bacterium RBG_16_38_10]
MSINRKTFIIGLDGASWDLLNPLMDEGVMPNLKRIVDNGTSGNLLSTIPPYTAPAWVSCVTGVNPGKHGVFGFTVKKKGVPGANPQFVESSGVNVPKLWNYINNNGRTVGLINVPITYPAETVNGFVVPCFLTPLKKVDYTYPVSIYREFLMPADYVINVRMAESHNPSVDAIPQIINALMDMTQKRFQVMESLLKAYQPDFFMIVFTSLDKVQHKFWKYLDPNNPMYVSSVGENIRHHLTSIYNLMDRIIGKIIEGIDDLTTLYIVSDHGFCSKDKIFYINKWLAKNGYLKLKKTAMLKQHFFGGNSVKDFSDRNIDILNHPIYRFVDMGKSCFIGSDPYEQGIYCINDMAEKKLDKLVQDLKGLKDNETGLNLFKKVCRKSEIYSGDYAHMAPDVILQMEDYSCDFVRGYTLRKGTIFRVKNAQGSHHPKGIFAAYGRDIAARKKVDADIMDIAPTILYNMGFPVSSIMDGKVLGEIFNNRFVETNEIKREDYTISSGTKQSSPVYTDEDKEEIAARLGELGYLD